LKFAIRYLRAENSHLKGKDALNALDWHLQPRRRRALRDQNEGELLKSVASEAKSLLKVLHYIYLFVLFVLLIFSDSEITIFRISEL
jgi:hypothetical protein